MSYVNWKLAGEIATFVYLFVIEYLMNRHLGSVCVALVTNRTVAVLKQAKAVLASRHVA